MFIRKYACGVVVVVSLMEQIHLVSYPIYIAINIPTCQLFVLEVFNYLYVRPGMRCRRNLICKYPRFRPS